MTDHATTLTDLPGRLHFALATLACLAVVCFDVGGPLGWLGTWLHEISHGLAATATGGGIVDIVLNYDGSGTATSRGGNATLTAFGGYAGAPILAGLLYAAASLRGGIARLAIAFAAVGTLGAVLWYGRGAATIVIGATIATLLAGIAWIGSRVHRHWPGAPSRLGQYAALLVVIQETLAPLGSIVNGARGDAAAMAAATWIPATVWALVWAAIGAAVFLAIARHGTRRPPGTRPAERSIAR